MAGLEKGQFYWLQGDKIFRVDSFDSESDGHKAHMYVAGDVLDPHQWTVGFSDERYPQTISKLSRLEPVTAAEKKNLRKISEHANAVDVFEKFFGLS